MAVSMIRCASTAPKVVSSSKKSTTVRSHSGKASSSSSSASASSSGAAFLASAVLVAGAPSSARASELTEKLAGFLDAVDAASETVASGVSQTVEVAKQVKEAYDEAVPVVTPYAERAL